jgi:hypothetical protein
VAIRDRRVQIRKLPQDILKLGHYLGSGNFEGGRARVNLNSEGGSSNPSLKPNDVRPQTT